MTELEIDELIDNIVPKVKLPLFRFPIFIENENRWDVKFDINFYGKTILSPIFNSIGNFEASFDDKFRIVYATRNLISNKWYVGQHSTKNIEDNYIGSGKIFRDAVKSYGKENFKMRVCGCFEDRENLNKAEIHYIKYFDSRNREHGYNLDFGGNVPTVTEEMKLASSKRMKGRTAWNKGLTGIYSEEQIKNMSERQKLVVQSEESNRKRSEKLKGRKISEESTNKRLKTCLENDSMKKKDSTKELLRQANLGKKQSQETINKRKSNDKRIKSIVKFDLNGTFLERFDSNPFSAVSILGSCKGKVRQSGGFIWLYEEDYINDNNILQERLNKLSESLPILICPYCGFESAHKMSIMRFHFDNCLENPKLDKEKRYSKNTKEKYQVFLANAPFIYCPHCDVKSKSAANMNRWHFDNCKQK